MLNHGYPTHPYIYIPLTETQTFGTKMEGAHPSYIMSQTIEYLIENWTKPLETLREHIDVGALIVQAEVFSDPIEKLHYELNCTLLNRLLGTSTITEDEYAAVEKIFQDEYEQLLAITAEQQVSTLQELITPSPTPAIPDTADLMFGFNEELQLFQPILMEFHNETVNQEEEHILLCNDVLPSSPEMQLEETMQLLQFLSEEL